MISLDLDKKLKSHYNSSRNYLKRLNTHNQHTFSPYLDACINNITEGSLILDCGCGTGFSSHLLSMAGFRVIGLDLSFFFVLEGTKDHGTHDSLALSVGNVRMLSFNNEAFDAVCSFDLIEHVTDVNHVFEEMCRVLKSGGVLIIFTPNRLNPFQNLFRFLRWEPKNNIAPWEPRSRLDALYHMLKYLIISVLKSIGLNKKIYYLHPLLSDEKDKCGLDFDLTWLSNWFDIENILINLDFTIKEIPLHKYQGRDMKIMQTLMIPKLIQSFYIKMSTQCIIVAEKK